MSGKSKTIKGGPKNIARGNKKTTIAAKQARTNIINTSELTTVQNILRRILKRKTI
jgi:hypothetical protein